MKNKRALIGVYTNPASKPFSDVKDLIEKINIKEGTVVEVEYSFHHFYRQSVTEQDIFWKKLIKNLKEKKCKIVFLDSEKLRSQMDLIQRKRKKLTLADAKIMYDKRESVFMNGIPECEFSFLGADHAIRLGKKAKADVFPDAGSFIMYKKGLLALSPNQAVNPVFIEKRKRVLKKLRKEQKDRQTKQKRKTTKKTKIQLKKRL